MNLPAGLVFPHTFVPWFRSVAPYIHAYRGKTFVVAIAGEGIAAGKLSAFVHDLAILHAMGIKLLLVHGFRPQVSEQLKAKGITDFQLHYAMETLNRLGTKTMKLAEKPVKGKAQN